MAGDHCFDQYRYYDDNIDDDVRRQVERLRKSYEEIDAMYEETDRKENDQ